MIICSRDPDLRSDEDRAGDTLRRISDFTNQLSFSGDFQYPALAIDCLPDVAFSIDFEPIRISAAIMLPENSLVSNVSSRGIEVERDDTFLSRVREVQSLVISGPPNAIGDRQGIPQCLPTQVRIETEERTWFQLATFLGLRASQSPLERTRRHVSLRICPAKASSPRLQVSAQE